MSNNEIVSAPQANLLITPVDNYSDIQLSTGAKDRLARILTSSL
jgi:hypothetical protein